MKPNTVGRVSGQTPQTGQTSPSNPVETGLVQGAILLTLKGETPVEDLSVGDKIITRDSGIAKVEQIRKVKQQVNAIALTAGSLGHTRPERDVILAAEQMILIRDWRAEALFGAMRALVSAKALVDGEFILDAGLQELTLYQILCDGPHILYADGLELGTADARLARGQVLHAA